MAKRGRPKGSKNKKKGKTHKSKFKSVRTKKSCKSKGGVWIKKGNGPRAYCRKKPKKRK